MEPNSPMVGPESGPWLPVPPHPGRRRWRRRGIALMVLAVLAGIGWVARRPILVGYASWFRIDRPHESDALVLLLGGPNHRPSRVAELYKQGLAPVVLLGRSLDRPGHGLSETLITLELLERRGVPRSAVVVLPEVVTSTRDEARAVARYAREHGMRSVTLVTTSFHTRRARWIFRRTIADSEFAIHVAAAREPIYDEEDWYTTDEGLIAYLNETIKTLFYYLAY